MHNKKYQRTKKLDDSFQAESPLEGGRSLPNKRKQGKRPQNREAENENTENAKNYSTMAGDYILLGNENLWYYEKLTDFWKTEFKTTGTMGKK